MFDKTFFKMAFEFMCVVVVGMLLFSIISTYSTDDAPAEASVVAK
ncbi:MAG: hypothetical protein WC767_03740 [Candidatus Paceibacterota bacterium]|jgi:hypothetical protein